MAKKWTSIGVTKETLELAKEYQEELKKRNLGTISLEITIKKALETALNVGKRGPKRVILPTSLPRSFERIKKTYG
jgi:hypothetical protein